MEGAGFRFSPAVEIAGTPWGFEGVFRLAQLCPASEKDGKGIEIVCEGGRYMAPEKPAELNPPEQWASLLWARQTAGQSTKIRQTAKQKSSSTTANWQTGGNPGTQSHRD